MYICRLFDRDGILRKTLDLERFTEYLSVPEREINPDKYSKEAEATVFKPAVPQSQFVFSHIIEKDANNVECYYAQR